MRCATYSNRRRQALGLGMERTLAVGPMGMSSTRCVDPAGDAVRQDGRPSGLSRRINGQRALMTEISTSSAGGMGGGLRPGSLWSQYDVAQLVQGVNVG